MTRPVGRRHARASHRNERTNGAEEAGQQASRPASQPARPAKQASKQASSSIAGNSSRPSAVVARDASPSSIRPARSSITWCQRATSDQPPSSSPPCHHPFLQGDGRTDGRRRRRRAKKLGLAGQLFRVSKPRALLRLPSRNRAVNSLWPWPWPGVGERVSEHLVAPVSRMFGPAYLYFHHGPLARGGGNTHNLLPPSPHLETSRPAPARPPFVPLTLTLTHARRRKTHLPWPAAHGRRPVWSGS